MDVRRAQSFRKGSTPRRRDMTSTRIRKGLGVMTAKVDGVASPQIVEAQGRHRDDLRLELGHGAAAARGWRRRPGRRERCPG
jgi:hypothetical protein